MVPEMHKRVLVSRQSRSGALVRHYKPVKVVESRTPPETGPTPKKKRSRPAKRAGTRPAKKQHAAPADV